MNRFREEIKVIPAVAWAVAVTLTIAIGWFFWMVAVAPGGIRRGIRPEPLLILGLLAVVFCVYILIVGYIVADARRRGMPVLLWTLLALFIPSAIGMILYFIVRRPLLQACSQCGKPPADAAYAFCPSCGAALRKTCPSCHGSVEFGWAHCAKCGAALQTT